jgi:hypothetical protein
VQNLQVVTLSRQQLEEELDVFTSAQHNVGKVRRQCVRV